MVQVVNKDEEDSFEPTWFSLQISKKQNRPGWGSHVLIMQQVYRGERRPTVSQEEDGYRSR